jgi:hypothetical protein
MINHGLSTGALFLLIGMIYERYHTRNMKELGGLAAKMPVWATFMVFFAMASVGLPGLNGFVSEFMCLLGAFQASSATGATVCGAPPPARRRGPAHPSRRSGTRGWRSIAGIGMIIAAIYLLVHGRQGRLGIRSSSRTARLYPTPVLRTLEGPVSKTVGHVRGGLGDA